MKNNLYPKEQLETIVQSCYSYAEVLRKLGKHQTGGNQSLLKKYIERYQIDTSHFTGQRWQINKTSEEIARRKLDTILQENTNFKSFNLKNRLVNNGLKENKCEICGIGELWNNKPITLELHHINGNHYDNRLENLQILCPNCHSQTNNFRNRNRNKQTTPIKDIKSSKISICKHCGKEFKKGRESNKFCSRECYTNFVKSLNKSEVLAITKESLYKEINNCNSIKELSLKFGVSRPTIRKYLKLYSLLEKVKSKYNFHTKPILQCDPDHNLVKEWPSIADAKNTLKISGIEKVCKFQRKSAGGYIWRYKK